MKGRKHKKEFIVILLPGKKNNIFQFNLISQQQKVRNENAFRSITMKEDEDTEMYCIRMRYETRYF